MFHLFSCANFPRGRRESEKRSEYSHSTLFGFPIDRFSKYEARVESLYLPSTPTLTSSEPAGRTPRCEGIFFEFKIVGGKPARVFAQKTRKSCVTLFPLLFLSLSFSLPRPSLLIQTLLAASSLLLVYCV